VGSTLRVTLGGNWANALRIAARKIIVDPVNQRRILDGRGRSPLQQIIFDERRQPSLHRLRFNDVNDTFFAESALAPL
jgi:hypothetical protein